MQVLNCFASTIKKFDHYGSPVSILFQGHGSYRTIFGGIISILFFAVVGCFMGLRIE